MNHIIKSKQIGSKWTTVRNCVQNKEVFAIYNFYSKETYNKFLIDLDKFNLASNSGKLEYFTQHISTCGKFYPSVFVLPSSTLRDNESYFRKIVLESMKFYSIDSCLLGTSAGVYVCYVNNKSHKVGENIYGSIQRDEFLSDFYEIDGFYYTIL